MQEVRCSGCGKLLAKAIFTALEIKCPRCKTIFNKLSTPSAANARSVRKGDASDVRSSQHRLPGLDGRDG